MKIVSILPSATEIIYALGEEEKLVAVSHQCIFPEAARHKPTITYCANGGSKSSYEIDVDMLQELDADIILTQQLCDIHAVHYREVQKAISNLTNRKPRIIILEPFTVHDTLQNICLLGEELGCIEKADFVSDSLHNRTDYIRRTVMEQVRIRPRVTFLEGLNPLIGAGNWNPELVSLAGGYDSICKAHQPAEPVNWESILEFSPEVLIIAQFGLSIAASLESIPALENLPDYTSLPAVGNNRVYVVNASHYFCCPGPRLVDSLEILACIIHPDLFEDIKLPKDCFHNRQTGSSASRF